jgi:hypothetical protein
MLSKRYIRLYLHPKHNIVQDHTIKGFSEAKFSPQPNEKLRSDLNVSWIWAPFIDNFFWVSEDER